MSNLQITDETVYVVYRFQKPYDGYGRKLVYTELSKAKATATVDSKKIAKAKYEQKRKDSGYDIPEWYQLQLKEQKRLIQIERDSFEIVEYGPKDNRGGVINVY